MSPEIAAVREAIAEAERERSLDGRTSWSKIAAREDGALEVLLSRREVLEGLSRRLGGEPARGSGSFEAPGLAARLAGEGPGDRLWTTASVADVRRGPDHATELLTQAIMGETMSVLDRRGDWQFVMLEDGYHGWVRSWYARPAEPGEVERFRGAARHVVAAPIASVLSGPEAGSLPVSDITAGSQVIVLGDEGGFAAVEIPGGRRGYLDRSAIEPARGAAGADGGAIAGRALRFLGITYVWGGTSGKGFDCSGLVKRVFEMEGIRVPRDSDQQAVSGREAPIRSPDAASPGSLLVFGEGGRITHVGISLGGGRFVHAYGDVRISSLIEGDSLFEERLARALLSARDLLETPQGRR